MELSSSPPVPHFNPSGQGKPIEASHLTLPLTAGLGLILNGVISCSEPACGGDPEVAYLAYAFPYRNRHRDTGNGLYTVPIHLSHLRASEYISAVYYLLIIFFFTFQKAPSRSPRPRSRAFAFVPVLTTYGSASFLPAAYAFNHVKELF